MASFSDVMRVVAINGAIFVRMSTGAGFSLTPFVLLAYTIFSAMTIVETAANRSNEAQGFVIPAK